MKLEAWMNPGILSPSEQMEIFLEACQELPWKIEDNAFVAVNENTGWQLAVKRKETELVFSTRRTYLFELSILVDPSTSSLNRTYTYIHTGDYNETCDKLLEQLYRKAQQVAQTSLLGPVPISTG